MTQGVSLPHVGVSLATNVSLQQNTTAMAAFEVSLIGGVSLTGNTTGSTPPPVGFQPAYKFNDKRNSFYITTTAF